jgi:hypothetical protein
MYHFFRTEVLSIAVSRKCSWPCMNKGTYILHLEYRAFFAFITQTNCSCYFWDYFDYNFLFLNLFLISILVASLCPGSIKH